MALPRAHNMTHEQLKKHMREHHGRLVMPQGNKTQLLIHHARDHKRGMAHQHKRIIDKDGSMEVIEKAWTAFREQMRGHVCDSCSGKIKGVGVHQHNPKTHEHLRMHSSCARKLGVKTAGSVRKDAREIAKEYLAKAAPKPRDHYTSAGTRLSLHANKESGHTEVHSWQYGKIGSVKRSGDKHHAYNEMGKHLAEHSSRHDAIEAVHGDHLRRRYG
jgi:hypothetical protein